MNVIVVDNVNNLSGAPMVANSIASSLGAFTFCIRQTREPIYDVVGFGIRSEKRRNYLSGSLSLLLNAKFWLHLMAARVVICNTCLTFPFAVLARLLGKRVICVIHESSPKNILYRIGLFASSRAAHRIVTPSWAAYQDIDLPIQKRKVIPNALAPDYSETGSCIDSWSKEVRVLFVGGGRAYKGEALFREVQEYLRLRHPALHLHAVGDAAFTHLHGASLKLTPQIYRSYHFVLVLTDNAVWKETFGLVGCEAAACRCLPLFTDRFAYYELWKQFSKQLLLPLYNAESIAMHLMSLLHDRAILDQLRDAVRQHALNITQSSSVTIQWKDITNCVDNQNQG